MNHISAIKNYILYLKRTCGLYISLHPVKYDKLIYPSELLTFNIHESPYCIYIKTCPTAQQHCIAKQEKVIDKCKNRAYTGICYAGVKERLYPMIDHDETIGFISVSGYQCNEWKSYVASVANRYQLSLDKLQSSYQSMKKEMPDSQELDTLLMPLVAMLELEYSRAEPILENEQMLFQRIECYLRKYHNQQITVGDLCREFSCSTSCISHNFKQYTGMSLKRYISGLRTEDAKSLLRYSNLSIMDIALAIGFNDSNYFSSSFKKIVGTAPMDYRKQSRIETK